MQDTLTMSKKEYNEMMLRKDIIEHLKIAEAEIERGEGIELDAFLKEMRQKYKYK